jgi:hypothetical protein
MSSAQIIHMGHEYFDSLGMPITRKDSWAVHTIATTPTIKFIGTLYFGG